MPAFAGAGIQFGCEGNLSRIHSWSLDTIVDLLSCTSHSPLQFCKASKAPHRLHSGQGEGRVLANFHLERHLLVALWLTSGYLILRLSSSSLQSRMFVSKVKSSLPRCQSDSVLVQPSTSRSASVDPAAAWRAEKHFTSKLRIIFACKSRETCSTEDGSVLRATECATVLPEGMPSVGSVLHESQQCRPCAWSPGCMLKTLPQTKLMKLDGLQEI